MIGRRPVLAGLMALPLAACMTPRPLSKGQAMYGLIGRMTATPGNRAALAAVLLEATAAMPGCLSYIIAEDPADENALWITEVWTDKDAHAASLSLRSVQEAIRRGRPLIDGMDRQQETRPLGGQGLPR